MIKAIVGYPAATVEQGILDKYVQGFEADRPATYGITAVTDGRGLEALRQAVETVRVESKITAYITAVVRGTRDAASLTLGASPRAVEQMGDAVRAFAMLDGRDYVLPDDVKRLAEPVFGHRLVPTTDARIRDRGADEILREILRSVPVPTELDT